MIAERSRSTPSASTSPEPPAERLMLEMPFMVSTVSMLDWRATAMVFSEVRVMVMSFPDLNSKVSPELILS